MRVPAKLTLHGLRDFNASGLIKHNENVKTVQMRRGHSEPNVTLDKYTGLWPTGEDTTADAIESVTEALTETTFLAPSAPVVPARPSTRNR